MEAQAAIRYFAHTQALRRSVREEEAWMECQGAMDVIRTGKRAPKYTGSVKYVWSDARSLGSAKMVKKAYNSNAMVCRVCLQITSKLVVPRPCGHIRCLDCVQATFLFQPPSALCPLCGQKAAYIEVPKTYVPGILADRKLEELKFNHPLHQFNHRLMEKRRRWNVSPLLSLSQQARELRKICPGMQKVSLISKTDVEQLLMLFPRLAPMTADKWDYKEFWNFLLVARGVTPTTAPVFHWEECPDEPPPESVESRNERTNLNHQRMTDQERGLLRRAAMRKDPRVLSREFEEQKAAARDLDISEAPRLSADLARAIKEAAEEAPAVPGLLEMVAWPAEKKGLDVAPPAGGQVAGSPKTGPDQAGSEAREAEAEAVRDNEAGLEEDHEPLVMTSSGVGDVVDVSSDPSEDEDALPYSIAPEDEAAGWSW